MMKSIRLTALVLCALSLFMVYPAYASPDAGIGDGLYTIGVNSSSDMFNVVKCVLDVDDGKTTGTLTLSGTGYGYLYLGTGEEAAAALKSDWIPFAEDFEGKYTYTMPIPALDADIPVAAYSIKKEKWYDRILHFTSATLAPYDCVAPDGNYDIAVQSDADVLSGTDCTLSVKSGAMTAKLSNLPDNVSALNIDGEEIAVNDGKAAFPVTSLDKKLTLRVCVGGAWTDCWLELVSASAVSSALTCEDGVYAIDVKSDSGLFRVSECALRADNGTMKAELTVSNGNYDFLYIGSATDALKGESAWLPIIANADGTYTLEMDVTTLDNPIRVATHSPTKDMWYDRELTFLSETLQPVQDDASTALPDGEYIPDGFTFTGGTGKVTISCEHVIISNGSATARIVFSSAKYTQLRVNGETYMAASDSETATFEIPVTLNSNMEVIGTTTVMSKTQDITYTIHIALGEPDAEPGIAPTISGLEYEFTTELAYAECFSIYRYKGGYSLIEIKDGERILVIPEGGTTPDSLPSDIIPLQKPVKNIYLAATSAMALFDSLDALDSLRLTGTNISGWYIENAVSAMERGNILFAGKYSEPDFELLLRENCALAIESTMILHSPDVREMIELLKIPVIIDRSSYETHPLGRTEWIKLYGAIVGKEEAAAAFFAKQAAILDESEGFEKTGKTVAFFYIASDGSVVVRNNTDYVVKMIELAGGAYAFADVIGADETRSSVSISMEDFYAAAVNADYLVYNATIDDPLASVAELLAKSGTLSDFKAVQAGNVWCTGKYLYQATDIIGSLIGDFHAMLTGDGEDMTFLYKID